MSSNARWLWLSCVLAAAWAIYAVTLLKQVRLLTTVDPIVDTGVAFGYEFLVRICGPALLILTLAAIVAVTVFNARLRPSRPQETEQIQSSR